MKRKAGSNFPVDESAKMPTGDIYREIHRGGRAASFVRSEFWLKDFKPYLKDMIAELDKGNRWTPKNKHTVDAVALGVSFHSGGAEHIEEVMAEIQIWIAQAEEGRESIMKKNSKEKNKR